MKLSVLNQVRLSPGSTAARALRDAIELACLADALGYERYWIAEHHGSDGLACPCPEVLLAAIGAATSRIRIGAGGILLPHYSAYKVAECFRALDHLYPGRIDLGIGRSAGAGPIETAALRRRPSPEPFGEDFSDQLAELRHFLNGTFPDDHAYRSIRVSPDGARPVPVWLLGSSQGSAEMAAAAGLPYAFAQFINPLQLEASCRAYLGRPHDGRGGRERRLIVALSAMCLDTEADVQRLAAEARRDRPPAPAGAPASAGRTGTHPVRQGREWEKSRFIGTPERVRRDLLAAAAAAGVDELMVLAPMGDAATVRHSYRLLAEAFDLAPAAAGHRHEERSCVT